MSSIRPDPNLLKKYPNALTQDDIDRRQRYQAVLVGLAVGDALGAGVDDLTPEDVEARHPEGPREIIGGGAFDRPRGQPGAVSQTALIVAESLSRSAATLDLDDVCRRLVEWLETSPKDVSRTLKAGIENLRAGDAPGEAGAVAWEDLGRERSADNAALALCVPMALSSFAPTDRLFDDLVRLCRATHYDPRCVGASVALVQALGGLVRGEEDFIERAALSAAPFHDDVRAVIERSQARPPAALKVDGPTRSDVLTAVEIAFSAVTFAGTFEDGLAEVVSRGGDADVNGAIAGALLGARFGSSAVPERWVKATAAVPRLSDAAGRMYRSLGGK